MKRHKPPIHTLWGVCLFCVAVCWLATPCAVAQGSLRSPTQAVPILAPPSVPQLPAAPALTTSVPAPSHPTMLQVLGNARRGLCAHIRHSPIGQLTAGIRKPLSMATGGMVPAEKPPHPDEKSQPGPEGTAAQLKTVKLQAPKRQNAIRQLQYIDVRYHPEVEATLIAALRADPSECVRLEAALALATLPICSPAIRRALTVCVESRDNDGNPAELSERVRLHAGYALVHCANCAPMDLQDGLERPEYPGQAAIELLSVMQASASLPIAAALAGDTSPTGLNSISPNEIELTMLSTSPLTNEVRLDPVGPAIVQPARTAPPSRPRNLLQVFQAAE